MLDSDLQLQIIHNNDDIIIINKPHGLLVHRSKIADDADVFAVQMLRDQINQKVYPVHRLDRKTSGLLMFTTNIDLLKALSKQFAENQIKKKYLAIVRGYTPEELEINYPLTTEQGKIQEANTHFTTLEHAEIQLVSSKHPTSRYSLISVCPQTGRMHQIRKHMAHIFHPIIGDRPHGCNKQNKIFKEHFNMNTMLLHAYKLSFTHPDSKTEINVTAPLFPEFLRMLSELNFTHTF
ncbi:MAG: pseudouridylate synthase [Bacteroidales bacterium]|nr:pseudouridylate synthase [Bacteroidales bacterium]